MKYSCNWCSNWRTIIEFLCDYNRIEKYVLFYHETLIVVKPPWYVLCNNLVNLSFLLICLLATALILDV